MNPFKCQSSRSFSDLGSRSLGLNVHQNFKHHLGNHWAYSNQILHTTSMPHGKKNYIIGPVNMTKVADMPMYDKNHLKIFFSRTVNYMTLKLGRTQ